MITLYNSLELPDDNYACPCFIADRNFAKKVCQTRTLYVSFKELGWQVMIYLNILKSFLSACVFNW